MATATLPAAALVPRTDRPLIATTRNVQTTVLARQVAAVPAMLALRRAVCGADEGLLHPNAAKPLARFERAGELLQRTYAATLVYLADASAPPPGAPTLSYAVEEYACADIALAEEIEPAPKLRADRI
jgi:hypothetical protein